METRNAILMTAMVIEREISEGKYIINEKIIERDIWSTEIKFYYVNSPEIKKNNFNNNEFDRAKK